MTHLYQLNQKKVVIFTLVWSTIIYYTIAALAFVLVEGALEGNPLTKAHAIKLALIIGLVNGIGFGLLNNILRARLGINKYHIQVFIVSMILKLLSIILTSVHDLFVMTKRL